MLLIRAIRSYSFVPCVAYTQYERVEELNGAFQISFNVPRTEENASAFNELSEEAEVVDKDGNTFFVKQMRSTHNMKSVVAVHKLFTLSDVFRHDIIGGTNLSLKSVFDMIFKDTDVNYTLDGSLDNQTVNIVNFGGASVTALLEQFCSHIGADRYIIGSNNIHITMKPHDSIPAQHVFEYASNIKALEHSVDTSNIKTVITGFSEKMAGKTVYKSPNVSVFGEREADPFEDNDIEDEETMVAELRTRIKDEPDISITLSVLDLDAKVGDRVYLIHKPLGLNLVTRVLSRTTTFNKQLTSITIGNTVQRTLSDVLAEQKKEQVTNERRTRSRIEQTESSILAEVTESFQNVYDVTDALIEAHGDLEGVVTTNTETIAAIEITAGNIKSTVSEQVTAITNLGEYYSEAMTQIEQTAKSIEAKVSYEDFTGEVIVSKINLTNSTATIDAKNINLIGAVEVLSDLTGELGTITAGTINGAQINSAQIDIKEDIKVGDKIYLNGSDGEESGLYFNRNGSRGKIYDSGYGMVMYSDNFRIESEYGVNVYGGMDILGGLKVDDMDVVTSRTSGISIGVSEDSKRLYIAKDGADIGYITYTPIT